MSCFFIKFWYILSIIIVPTNVGISWALPQFNVFFHNVLVVYFLDYPVSYFSASELILTAWRFLLSFQHQALGPKVCKLCVDVVRYCIFAADIL